MPNKRIVKNICNALRSLPGWPSLRVLDLSCGDGAVLDSLSRDGCDVEGTHFRDDDYILKDPREILRTARVHKHVDLTAPIPLPSASYDVVLATEVIEHLPSHVLLYAEISRLLKPGGHGILTTPNIHRLQSRIRFALTGQHELRSARLGWDVPASQLYSTHFNPVYFPVMHTLLYQNAMRIQSVMFTKCKPAALPLVCLYPLICVATVFEARHALKRSPAGGRDLLRWMLDIRGLYSDQLMILAKKDNSSGGCPKMKV